jgi:hypothetical protein
MGVKKSLNQKARDFVQDPIGTILGIAFVVIISTGLLASFIPEIVHNIKLILDSFK